nr:hypothetical protein [Tanacetum cinerariifolium]
MELCTKLFDKVLDLEKTKTAQAKEIADLKKSQKVGKKEKVQNSRDEFIQDCLYHSYKVSILVPLDLSKDTKPYTRLRSPRSIQLGSTIPSKTPSTKDTSLSSIDYTPKSSTLSSSSSINGYLNPPLSSPPRVPPSPPTQATQENASMDITLTLLPITPLDV